MQTEKVKTASSEFSAGFFLPLNGINLLFRNRGLKRYAILPLVFGAVFYAIVLGLFFYLAWDWEISDIEWQFWGGFGKLLGDTIDNFASIVKWVLLIPAALLACYFSFTTVGMVIASPVNDILSERVERALCYPGEKLDVPLRLNFKTALYSLRDSAVIILCQGGLSLLALPFLLVPGAGFLPLFIVTAYFTGLGFVDVGMARNCLRNRHKNYLLRNLRWRVLGFGVAMELLFMIPFLGLLLLPLGVTAGTDLYCSFDWRKAFEDNSEPFPQGFIPPEKSSI